MLKKMVILGVIGFVAVSALGGTKLASYIKSELREARERAESNIPPEKEIARLKNEIKLLDKDIVNVIDELAKQTVAADQLQAQSNELAAKQTAKLADLKARGEAIKSSEGHVTFGNQTYNIATAKADLERDANAYKSTQKLLESQRAALANRLNVRDSLKKQLEAMQAQKGELTAAVSELEAQLVALKAQQAQSKYQTDDTRLSKIKEDIRNLKTKLDVEKKKNELMQTHNPDAAPAAAPAASKSVDDILGSLEPTKPTEGEKAGTKVPTAD